MALTPSPFNSVIMTLIQFLKIFRKCPLKASLAVQQGIKFSLSAASRHWHKIFHLCSKTKIPILCQCLHDLDLVGGATYFA